MAQMFENVSRLMQLNGESLNATLFSPIKNYSRIKYTCFDVCDSYIACGSSSGGLYLFHRCSSQSLVYLYTIPNNEGKISALAFSGEDDNVIAVGTSKGSLFVVQLLPNNEWQYLYTAVNFASSSIIYLLWAEDGDFKLFIAAENCHIYYVNKVTSLKHLLISPLPTLIIKVESRVCQMDACGEYLLISTLNQTFLYDINSTTLTQVGSKPRPSGEYGACFYPREVSNGRVYRCIYTARPGTRLWECDLRGNVHFTHIFKRNLANSQFNCVIKGKQSNHSNNIDFKSFSPTFKKIFKLRNSQLLLAYSSEPQSALFVIDPFKAAIVLWTSLYENIEEIHCSGEHLFILHNTRDENVEQASMSPTFIHLVLMSAEQCFDYFTENKEVLNAIDFVENNLIYFQRLCKEDHTFYSKVKNVFFLLNQSEQSVYSNVKQLIESKTTNHNEYKELKANGEREEEEVQEKETEKQTQDVSNEVEKRLQLLRNKLNVKNDLICSDDCGFPAPGSHLQLNDARLELHTLLRHSIQNEYETSEHYLNICRENALWSIYMQLLLRCQLYEEYITYALCLTDLSLLQNKHIVRYLNENNRWELFFEKFAKLNVTETDCKCLNCGKVRANVKCISWRKLIEYVSANNTIEDCIRLLRESAVISNHAIDATFCNSLLRSAIVNQYQSTLSRQKLSELSATCLRPQQGNTSEWSVKLNLSEMMCAKCNMCLAHFERLIVFKCKHVYHSNCCSVKSHCQVCHQ